MTSFNDQLKKHMGKMISICLDDRDTLISYEITEVGDDYICVKHESVHRIIPINRITFIQELD